MKPRYSYRTGFSHNREKQCSENLENAVQLEKSFPEKLVTEAVVFKRIKGDKISITLVFKKICVVNNRIVNSWNYKHIIHENCSSYDFEHYTQEE